MLVWELAVFEKEPDAVKTKIEDFEWHSKIIFLKF